MMRCCFSYLAASFSVPLTASVTEGGSATICVTMMATPENATLENEVVVNLSNMDGSGEDDVTIINNNINN